MGNIDILGQYCPLSIKLLIMSRLATFFGFAIFILFLSKPISAQWLEAGVMVGASNYMGDLVENDLDPNEYNFSYGLFGRYQMTPFLSFKAYLNRAKLSGEDSNNRSLGLVRRNLSFRTNLVELGFVNEISITPYDPRENKNALPYLFVGISGFYFNPQAEFQGEYVNLRPLGTEGQGNVVSGSKKYSPIGIAVPVGFGFKWNLNSLINVGCNFGFRITATDYLDDVSTTYPNIDLLAEQNPIAASLSFRGDELNTNLDPSDFRGKVRGNPDNADWYFIANVAVSINLTDEYGMEWNPKFRSFSEEPVPAKEFFRYKPNLSKIRKKEAENKRKQIKKDRKMKKKESEKRRKKKKKRKNKKPVISTKRTIK